MKKTQEKKTSRWLKQMKSKKEILAEANAKSSFKIELRPTVYIVQYACNLIECYENPQSATNECVKAISALAEIITPIHNALTNNVASGADSCPDKEHNEKINEEFKNMVEAYETIKTIDASQLIKHLDTQKHSPRFYESQSWEDNLKKIGQINSTFDPIRQKMIEQELNDAFEPL